jgi:23S rRNA pseudouridine1911/1915/1917 synthase
VTHVRPVEQVGRNYTLVACELETGRTHQIRIHLCEIGHPLCGEQVYARGPGDAPAHGAADGTGAPRIALHSAELGLAHPVSSSLLRFTCPLPKDLETWLRRLRGESPAGMG